MIRPMTTIREAETPEDALAILKVRNEVREFMTRHRIEIGHAEQLRWFEQRANNGIHLYAIESRPIEVQGDAVSSAGPKQVIGYGLIQTDAHTRSRGEPQGAVTGAVTEAMRGKGYGRLIFSFLLAECWVLGAQPWLEVLSTNNAAIALYHALGFRETSRRGPDIITMMHFRR